MSAGDLEKIVNLLLSLCSRLMRIDRSLLALERDELAQEDAAEERVRGEADQNHMVLLQMTLHESS